MATQQKVNSSELYQFVNYMGVELTDNNMTIFTDLYVNFTGFAPQFRCGSFAEKFILWKRYYDEFQETQQQILNTNLFNSPPKDPRQLKPSPIQLPEDLQQIKNEENLFQNFILKNDCPTKPKPPQAQPTETASEPNTHNSSNIDPITTDDIISENFEV